MNEMFEDLRIDRNIICIDLVSFYASVECVERNLNPQNTYLIVADEKRGDNTVILAATPPVKKLGFKTRDRLYNISPQVKNKIIIVKPTMRKYVEYSLIINNIYKSFFAEEDLFSYSIDETFIDITNYLKLYNTTQEKLCVALKRKIFMELGLHVTVGCGPNMIMAKFALDIESKKCKNQIAIWKYEDIEQKLWPITNLTSVWGIGPGRAKRLRKLGITCMGDLATYPLDIIEKEMGIIGEELVLHANGIDLSRVQESNKLDKNKSMGVGQTLANDTFDFDVKNIINEMVFDTVLKMKSYNLKCSGIHLILKFNKKYYLNDINKHVKLDNQTSNYNVIRLEFINIFNQIYPAGIGVRSISISLTGLTEKNYEQLNLLDKKSKKRDDLDTAIISIRTKFGKNSIMTANSKYKNATGYERNKLIGGHNADENNK